MTDRLAEYQSSLSFKFNAALKEEENNELDYLRAELDNNDNDTLFDEMAQEMDYLEMDEDKAIESQRDQPSWWISPHHMSMSHPMVSQNQSGLKNHYTIGVK